MPKGVYPHTALKGKTYEEIHGVEKGQWMQRIRSGEKNPSKRPEVIQKILRTKRRTGEFKKHSRRMMGSGNPLFGKKRNCPWITQRNKEFAGVNAHNWQGGKSFEPYGLEWTDKLRSKIRRRDKDTCQLCGKQYKHRKLDVHHIDCNKRNNNPSNLITLCVRCHHKVHGLHLSRRTGKKTVYTFMCNDLFHIGHLKHIRKAKKLGNLLIVGVLTDEAIATYKRFPVIPFGERFQITDAVRGVYWTVIQHSRSPISNLKILRPNILVHGSDWDPHSDDDLKRSKEYVESIGGRLVLTLYHKGQNTTKIIEKIKGCMI